MYEDAEVKKQIGRKVFSPLAESSLTNLLWQLFPAHKCLLETAFDDESTDAQFIRQSPHVRKPIFGREGGSVSIIDPAKPEELKPYLPRFDEFLALMKEEKTGK